MNIDQGSPIETAEELYESAPCGYLSTLPDGVIASANRTFLDWVGAERNDLVGPVPGREQRRVVREPEVAAEPQDRPGGGRRRRRCHSGRR